eukprot:5451084-Pyramimonas_sp.AAC.1
MRSTLAAVVCGKVIDASLSCAAVTRGSADLSDLPFIVATTVGRGASGTRVARWRPRPPLAEAVSHQPCHLCHDSRWSAVWLS